MLHLQDTEVSKASSSPNPLKGSPQGYGRRVSPHPMHTQQGDREMLAGHDGKSQISPVPWPSVPFLPQSRWRRLRSISPLTTAVLPARHRLHAGPSPRAALPGP